MKNETTTLAPIEDNRYDNSRLISCNKWRREDKWPATRCLESIVYHMMPDLVWTLLLHVHAQVTPVVSWSGSEFCDSIPYLVEALPRDMSEFRVIVLCLQNGHASYQSSQSVAHQYNGRSPYLQILRFINSTYEWNRHRWKTNNPTTMPLIRSRIRKKEGEENISDHWNSGYQYADVVVGRGASS